MKYIILTKEDILAHNKDMYFYLTMLDLTLEDQTINLTRAGDHKVISYYSRDKLPLVEKELQVTKSTWRNVRALFRPEVIVDGGIQFIDVEVRRKVAAVLRKELSAWPSRNTYAAIRCYMYCGCRLYNQFTPGLDKIIDDIGGDKSRLCKKLNDLCQWGFFLKFNTCRFNCADPRNNAYLIPQDYITYIFKKPC